MNDRPVPFVKMTGSGNNFVLVDNRQELVGPDGLAAWARAVCHPTQGVGADGLILLQQDPQHEVDFAWRFFNKDGSEPEMCGNGSRCAVRYAVEQGLAGRETAFRTRAGVIRGWLLDNGEVRVQLTDPVGYQAQVNVDLAGETHHAAVINTGVPHAVIEVPDTEAVDVRRRGRAIRHHPVFGPRGTNVNFVQVLGAGELIIRTYERGVEDETMACGTGCVAAGITMTLAGRTTQPVRLHTRGGEVLTVDFARDGAVVTRATLQGPVRYVAEGTIHPDVWR